MIKRVVTVLFHVKEHGGSKIANIQISMVSTLRRKDVELNTTLGTIGSLGITLSSSVQ